MKNILKTRKDEIVNKVGEDEFKKLQKVKILKLMELEIQQLIKYWSLSQTLEIINSELGFKISKTVFYEFCAKNIKKDEKYKSLKRDKKEEGVSQKIEPITPQRVMKKESSGLTEEQLSVVTMFKQ